MWAWIKDRASIFYMAIYCTFIVTAYVGIFTVGIQENDRLALKSLRASTGATARIAGNSGVSVLRLVETISMPVGLSADVYPTVQISRTATTIKECHEFIDDNDRYVAECPYRLGTTLISTVDRNAVLAPFWRDLTITLVTTISGLTFLMSYSVSTYRRRKALQRANAELESRNRVLEMTTFSLHHDIAGPTGDLRFSVDMLNEMVSQETISALGIGDVFSIMRQGIDRQEGVLNGLREWMHAGSGQFETEPVDIGVLVEELIDSSPYMAKIEVSQLPTLAVNRDIFKQALDNLIRNGVKYNDSPDKIVRIYRKENSIVIEDNGIGFDEKDFDRLTQPFQRSSNDDEGSGLGLAIVRQVVESHGFSLKAKSDIGVGSKFIIEYGGS